MGFKKKEKAMGHFQFVKEVIEKMSHQEILNLLEYLRKQTDIIIPKCYSKKELNQFLKAEGINGQLSEKDYLRLKNELDNSCKELMNEVLRTRILMQLDASLEGTEAAA
jgi:hypothetical protein